MRRPVHITADGDDKQLAAAASAGEIKKGLDVLWARYSFASELRADILYQNS